MNTKTVLKDQGLMPANSQAQEMMIVGFISLWVVLAAVLYFSSISLLKTPYLIIHPKLARK